MSNIFDKFLKAMNVNDYEEDDQPSDDRYDSYDDGYGERTFPVEKQQPRTFKSYTGGRAYEGPTPKVVNIQASIQMEVIVLQPVSYDEAQTICDHIKSKKPVILNLEKMERNVAQRIMDFVSGSC